MPPGRPHGLDQEDTREQLAQLLARNLTAPEIGEILGRHKDTIKVWRHDELVQERVSQIMRERVNRFISVIDGELEKRLEEPGKLTVNELVKIRQAINPKGAERGGPDPEAARRRWREEDQRTAAEPQGETVPIPSG